MNNPAVTVAEKNELIMLFQANALTEGVVTDESKAEVGDAIRLPPPSHVPCSDWRVAAPRSLCVHEHARAQVDLLKSVIGVGATDGAASAS